MNAKRMLWMVVAVISVLGLAAVAQAQTRPPHTGTTGITRTKSTPSYIVVEERDMKGVVTFEVILANTLNDRVKEMKASYEKALKDWNAAKTLAVKNKEKFEEKRPMEPLIAKVAGPFKDQAKAREEADRLQKAYDEALRKRQEAAKAKAAGGGTTTKPADDTKPETK